jgi:hypothetical protein
VIAQPPVWGFKTRFEWLASMIAYVTSMALGAMALATVIIASSIHAPRGLLVPLAFLCAIAASEAVHIRLPQSTWRVPQTWGRLGPIGFASSFGFALGIGLLTAVPSPGFYVAIYYALTGPPAGVTFLAFALYAVVRATPLLAVARLSYFRCEHPAHRVQRWSKTASALAPIEAVVLLAFGMNVLLMAIAQ